MLNCDSILMNLCMATVATVGPRGLVIIGPRGVINAVIRAQHSSFLEQIARSTPCFRPPSMIKSSMRDSPGASLHPGLCPW